MKANNSLILTSHMNADVAFLDSLAECDTLVSL